MHSHILTVVHGSAFLVIMPSDLVESLKDVSLFLESCGTKLDKLGNHTFGSFLKEGDSAFVPFGWTAVWVGMPNEPQLVEECPKLTARGRKGKNGQRVVEPCTEHICVALTLLVRNEDAETAGAGLKKRLLRFKKFVP